MGSRGQSAQKLLGKLDKASEKYYELQERGDHISDIGGRFYDNTTGKEVPREEVEKLSTELIDAREKFEGLRDQVIAQEEARESRAAERAKARAEKLQAKNAPAAFRVTTPDGYTFYYTAGADGKTIVDERGLPVGSVRGMSYGQLYARVMQNQGTSGAQIERMTAAQAKQIHDDYLKERQNRPDYESGLGTPWGNAENRRAARQMRLQSRIDRRRR